MAYSANQIRNKEQHREDRKAHNDITNKCVSENFRNPTWKHKSNDNNAVINKRLINNIILLELFLFSFIT
uniref:Uncharacterized protein n=1 Tax=Rhizophagus irregularis (strain DAOM 181602 / DAOM 197198 / MUCL 43194) TaxID=747089 RepID=U9T9I4_RHIID